MSRGSIAQKLFLTPLAIIAFCWFSGCSSSVQQGLPNGGGGVGNSGVGGSGATGNVFNFTGGSTSAGGASGSCKGADGGPCFVVGDAGPYCGDGVIEADLGEQCDDGNRIGGDGCSGTCQIEPNWKCPTAGSPCVSTIVCGDGIREPGEECDDGNTTNGDGCSSTCQVESGWYCAPSNPNDTTSTSVCQQDPHCGDGRINSGETCDLGAQNGVAGSGCDANCQTVPGYVCRPLPTGCKQQSVCGNGIIEPGEQCDDGNTVSGDGCSSTCQIEASYYDCSVAGQLCKDNARCGDGILEPGEQCDDDNTKSGDGCSSTCQVEAGWQCRVPGKPCVPLCGDGKIVGDEQCDTGNNAANKPDDGCSSTCQIEPGYSCTGTPSVCTKANCGNGTLETGEACDCGTSPTNLPAGCTGPNGLFNGDGSGCSNTCTKEPICRGTNGTGATHACTVSCGNGNIETGEQCDDGNLVNGDGCSSTCQIEPGFTCNTQTNPDTQPCTQSIYSGNCLDLPVKYRDFMSEKQTGGHPDFFYYGATLQTPVSISGVQGQANPLNFNTRYCVPNTSGPARQNDSTSRAWGMAQANLDNTGHPAYDTTRNGGGANAFLTDCQFTDWSHDTNGGHVPGYTMANSPLNALTYVSGTSGHPLYKGPAPVAASATSFGQWWIDSTYTNNTHKVGTIELGPVAGATNLFRFSSAPHSVYGGFFPFDPTANNFPMYTLTGSTAGPGTVTTSTSGNSEPLLCNLWPYWYSSATFGAGNGCKGDQYVFPPSFAPGVDPATWFGQNPNGAWIPAAQGWFHDSWFSVEARYLFAFNSTSPPQLQFFGDDDTFVFINGVLVIDLGGVHQRLPASVTVGTDGNATVQEGGNIYMACTNPTGQTNCPVIPAGKNVGDLIPCTGGIDPITKVAFNSTCPSGNTTCDCRQRTVALGLTNGSTYEIAIFERDGHPTESNFQLTLSGFTTTKSVCTTTCGDGVVTGGKECDCGTDPNNLPAGCVGVNNDTTYDGCTTQCTWGPYCGDGIVQTADGEQCDDGQNTTVAYDPNNPTACGPGCKLPPRCGDGVVQTGEQCDKGTANCDPTTADCYGLCTTSCTLGPYCGDAIVNGDAAHPEACDDGVNIGGYGYCAPGCVWGPRCGDGIVQTQYGETCDLGAQNGVAGSGCDANCGLPAVCGDGIVQPPEQCDYGAANNCTVTATNDCYNQCTTSCTLGPYCGDGVTQNPPEQCDYGAENAPLDAAPYGSCLVTCQLGPHCGDGIVQPPEQCDLGANNGPNSQCSSNCILQVHNG